MVALPCISKSARPWLLCISTPEFSYFHFGSNRVLWISKVSALYFDMSGKSLTIPAENLPGFWIVAANGRIYIIYWECHVVKPPFSSSLPIPITIY